MDNETKMEREDMSEHTPGPWEVVEADYRQAYAIKAGEEWVCEGGCGCCNDREDSISNLADARLIAAAPDLLGAAEEALENTPALDGPEGDKLRAAIAKAKGDDDS